MLDKIITMPYKYPRSTKHEVAVKRGNAGLGLFAKDNINKDDFVVEYFGPILNDEQAEEKGGKYLFALDKNLTIDGSTRKNLARYLNHSCRSNCQPEIDGRRVFIYAKKNVKPGDELTYNYGKEYYDAFIKPHGCRCSNH